MFFDKYVEIESELQRYQRPPAVDREKRHETPSAAKFFLLRIDERLQFQRGQPRQRSVHFQTGQKPADGNFGKNQHNNLPR